jgi:hypothetical protein
LKQSTSIDDLLDDKARAFARTIWSEWERGDLFKPHHIALYAFGEERLQALHLFRLNDALEVTEHQALEGIALKALRRKLANDTPRGEERKWWFLPHAIPDSATEAFLETGRARKTLQPVRSHGLLGHGNRWHYRWEDGAWLEIGGKRHWTT